jgi:DNA-binding IscR family transcriptional regulator
VQGGYELCGALSELTLGDILRALEPVTARRRLQNHTVLRTFPSCYVQGMAREVERKAIHHLYRLPLLELLSDMESAETPEPSLESMI